MHTLVSSTRSVQEMLQLTCCAPYRASATASSGGCCVFAGGRCRDSDRVVLVFSSFVGAVPGAHPVCEKVSALAGLQDVGDFGMDCRATRTSHRLDASPAAVCVPSLPL